MDDQPLAPHVIRAPPFVHDELVKTYESQGRSADCRDGQGPYSLVRCEARHNVLFVCADRGQDSVANHAVDQERAGYSFLVCRDLSGLFGMTGLKVVACHPGCVIACGRSQMTGR